MILHITVGFNYSGLYKQLFKELSSQAIKQMVYVPSHDDSSISKIDPLEYPYDIYTNRVIKKRHKLMYFSKINAMKKDVVKKINLKEIQIIHAHSLFSDGGVAYELYKQFNIPYIVAVRDTDINKYYKHAKHLKRHARNILDHAQQVIFLSPAYKNRLFTEYVNKDNERLIEKSLVIPNGINEFWHEQEVAPKTLDKTVPLKLLFVGQVTKRKNLLTVIKTVQQINIGGKQAELTVVGTGDLLETYQKQYSNDQIIFKGKVSDKEILQQIYRSHDLLVVPSFTETFGLVYIEAMSCGTPVIYSKGQGIDGYFKQGQVGYAVESTNLVEIREAIRVISNNYTETSHNGIFYSASFNWKDIAGRYREIYQSLLKIKGQQ